jgi:hypothetical protein
MVLENISGPQLGTQKAPVRIAINLILLLVLCSCHFDQKKQAALCEREAVQTYASQELSTDAQVAAHIRKCMQLHGYIQDIDAANCRTSDSSVAAKPYCYKPVSWMEMASDCVESLLEALERGMCSSPALKQTSLCQTSG